MVAGSITILQSSTAGAMTT